jgi:hypothetical protein
MRYSFEGIHFATRGETWLIRKGGDLQAILCPDGFRVAGDVSEVREAFVAK